MIHNKQFSVKDDVVVITGSSQGIGKTTAEQLAAGGAKVVVSSRSQEKVDAVAEEINDSDVSGEAIAVECDVRDRDAVEALMDATVEAFGRIDTLVNNAGASFMQGFDDISENGWKTIVDINLHGTFHCAQAAGERMQTQDDGGRIINFASIAGTRGAPYMSHYGAAKAAVVNFTTTLSVEYAPHDIRVNCIAPGLVATPGVESQMGVAADNVDRDSVDRQIGVPGEMADIVQFLGSDASSYIVGETIVTKGVPDIDEGADV